MLINKIYQNQFNFLGIPFIEKLSKCYQETYLKSEANGVVLVSLLLTLNIFHTLF